MAANAREARRKKIMERGSDRLALITGRIQDVQPPPASSAFSHSQPSDAYADSSPAPLIINDQTIPSAISHPNSGVSPQDEAEVSGPVLLKPDPVTDPDHSNPCKSSNQAPPLRELEHNQISHVPTSEVEQVQSPPGSTVVSSEVDQVQPPPGSTVVSSEVYRLQPPPDPSSFILGAEQQSSVQSRDPKLFTPREISSAITASKITRLCCSVVVALLVVFSYLGFPLLDNKYVKSILSFRPLYLVLVTNVTVVVAQLLSGKQRGSESAAGTQNRTSSDADHWTEHLGRALEAALVMRNVMDAMFMDCASYAITVICGLSLVQLFRQ
ncbi:uncharacterized protein LOC129286581 [Prosopis cineraria]|uniref:uncharacterized protein LOC129286581 n=1 Tax=Prosopis cineraria TaxID=364024 RepID=UPI002410AD52|nr:uncharacterized protein LOC129286581 [Prosopis cineraria]